MKNLTIVFLEENKEIPKETEKIEFLNYKKEKNILKIIEKATGKYILFIKKKENYIKNYMTIIQNKCQEEFDACYINYSIEIEGKKRNTIKIEENELKIKPLYGEYLWSYIWNKEKLYTVLSNGKESFNNEVENTFQNIQAIVEPIYHHIPGKKILENFPYPDEKEIVKEKNIIYMGKFCNGLFNGYITWLNNLGKIFGKEYEITILYDAIVESTKKKFQEHFKVLKRENDKLYVCNRLLVTYSTYYYPKNIIFTEENYLFIHGNMSDYPHSRKFVDNIYTKYIGVSKISAEKAKGYFPTNHFDYILNPIKINSEEIKPHLKLISAQRNDKIKKTERLHQLAKILDEEEIPYTWNLFTDVNYSEKEIHGGLIYRKSVQNPISYIKDADYYVQLSDSEAYCYSVVEALSVNTRVILTPLECYKELNISDHDSITIPFEYFNEENKEKLRQIVRRIYEEKEQKANYHLDEKNFEGYKNLFKK